MPRASAMTNGAAIELRSPHGVFTGRAHIAPMRPGNLEVHWPEGNVLLSGVRRDPASLEPDYNIEVTIGVRSLRLTARAPVRAARVDAGLAVFDGRAADAAGRAAAAVDPQAIQRIRAAGRAPPAEIRDDAVARRVGDVGIFSSRLAVFSRNVSLSSVSSHTSLNGLMPVENSVSDLKTLPMPAIMRWLSRTSLIG